MTSSFDAIQTGSSRRVLMLIAALAPATATVLAYFKPEWFPGVLLGATVSWLSFYWLKIMMTGLTLRVADHPGAKVSSRGLFFLFLLRYALIATITYAMIKSSIVSAKGAVCGMLLIVPALLIEGAYLMVQSRRHGG